MARKSNPSKLILDAISSRLEVDKTKLDKFVEYVEWILGNSENDWDEWEDEHGYAHYVECFDPANFWPLFTESLSFVLEREADSPRELCFLNSGPLSGNLLAGLESRQIRFLFLQLLRFFADFKKDRESHWWYEKGKEFPRTLEMLIDRCWIPFTDFRQTREKIDLLTSDTDKLKLAMLEKSRIEQELAECEYVNDDYSVKYLTALLRQLQIEVDLRKEIVELFTSIVDKPQGDAPATGEELIGKPCLTVDQFILLMFAIGGSRLKGLDKKKVAEGLSSLTGNSVNEFIKRFSWVLPTDKAGIKKFNNHTAAYNHDVEKVCEILTKMGLIDEVNKLKENSNI